MLRPKTGYPNCKYKRAGAPSLEAQIHLQSQVDAQEPNLVCVTDKSYIDSYEVWLNLAAVLDLFLRKVAGWSMSSRVDRELQ
jgi:putative transposase